MKYELNPALDVDYLKNLFKEDYDVVKAIFETFLNEVIPKWENISALLEEKNRSRLKQEVHGLKPAITIVGLSRLKPAFEEMEEMLFAEPVDYAALRVYYDNLAAEINRMVPVFREEIEKLSKLTGG